MLWNWQQKDWPKFRYDKQRLREFEEQFLHKAGILFGAEKHLSTEDKTTLKITLASDEAINTSAIEGEYLERDSVQSSIRRYLGLSYDNKKLRPAEQGISEMLVDVYNTYNQELTHEMLFSWHGMLMKGRRDLIDIGRYRTCEEPMQVVSGKYHDPKVHFEAPPSDKVRQEMSEYIAWYNTNSLPNNDKYSLLAKSGIAHLYFESIHPFEDGNGRLGRAIVTKSLSHDLGRPILLGISHVINKKKKAYYDALERNNKNNEITDFLIYFAVVLLEAQDYTINNIEFIINKTRFYDGFGKKLNDRQAKVIARIFVQGLEGFKGGLSADNYIRITNTTRATATRDLQDLVLMNAFVKTGILKGTRYYINL